MATTPSRVDQREPVGAFAGRRAAFPRAGGLAGGARFAPGGRGGLPADRLPGAGGGGAAAGGSGPDGGGGRGAEGLDLGGREGLTGRERLAQRQGLAQGLGLAGAEDRAGTGGGRA